MKCRVEHLVQNVRLECDKLLQNFGIKRLPWRTQMIQCIDQIYQAEADNVNRVLRRQSFGRSGKSAMRTATSKCVVVWLTVLARALSSE